MWLLTPCLLKLTCSIIADASSISRSPAKTLACYFYTHRCSIWHDLAIRSLTSMGVHGLGSTSCKSKGSNSIVEHSPGCFHAVMSTDVKFQGAIPSNGRKISWPDACMSFTIKASFLKPSNASCVVAILSIVSGQACAMSLIKLLASLFWAWSSPWTCSLFKSDTHWPWNDSVQKDCNLPKAKLI